MDIKLEESEMPLDSFETSSDVLLSQLSSQSSSQAEAASEILESSGVSRTSSPDRISHGTAGRNNHPTEPPTTSRRTADPETIRKVKNVVQQILHSLQQQDESIPITLKTRKRPGTSLSTHSNSPSTDAQYKLFFPGNTPKKAWRFSMADLAETVCSRTSSMLTCSPAVVLRILELIHEALINNVVVSKRYIYYKDPELFKSQRVVDRYVDILSYTFGVQRAALNVVSHLASYAFRAAKGYPDVSTRAFLHLLSISSYPPLPIYALVDFDPDGIAIMSTYKHGSLTLSHPKANLMTPTVRWLGVKSRDLDFNHSEREPFHDGEAEDRRGLLRLSKRDRKKAVNMLGQEMCEADGAEQDWRRELQVMLMLNLKVEMEILSDREGGVGGWVENRLLEGLMADTMRRGTC
ncbi:MAG: hypothetical protein Q9186_002507 [Xanthomendoza sp. 1 TL-2023]